jgi:predicted RNase H-like nuclease (RuvC/YqgF family)
MRQMLKKRLRIAAILFAASLLAGQRTTADDQALGDIARQQRQQQSHKSQPSSKVITNEDIPERPADVGDRSDIPTENNSPNLPSGKTAEAVKALIQAQKTRITTLQAQIKKLSDSVHFVEANRYNNGVQYNQYQQRKQQEVERLQKQLEQEQTKLEQMQESARRLGFGSAVYDPSN